MCPEAEYAAYDYDAGCDAWLGKTLLEIFNWSLGERIAMITGDIEWGEGYISSTLREIVEPLVKSEVWSRPTASEVLHELTKHETMIDGHIKGVRELGGVAAKNLSNIADSINELYYKRDVTAAYRFIKDCRWEKNAQCDACGSSSMIFLGTVERYPPGYSYSLFYHCYVCAGADNAACGKLHFLGADDVPRSPIDFQNAHRL